MAYVKEGLEGIPHRNTVTRLPWEMSLTPPEALGSRLSSRRGILSRSNFLMTQVSVGRALFNFVTQYPVHVGHLLVLENKIESAERHGFHRIWWTEFGPSDPQGKRRGQTWNYSPTFTHHGVYVHVHTHKDTTSTQRDTPNKWAHAHSKEINENILKIKSTKNVLIQMGKVTLMSRLFPHIHHSQVAAGDVTCGFKETGLIC